MDWASVYRQATDASIDASRKLHLLRAAEVVVSRETAFGLYARLSTSTDVVMNIDKFSVLDQDKTRTPFERKRDLSWSCGLQCGRSVQFIDDCLKRPTKNAYALRQLKLLSVSFLGDRTSDDALRYIRRASAKIHPDKISDLAGWDLPNTGYPLGASPSFRYEHAKNGALGLFDMLHALKGLHSDPYYRKALMSPPALYGRYLTFRQVASDFAVIGAALLVLTCRKATIFKTVLAGIAGSYAVLAALYAAHVIISRRNEQRRAAGMQVVLYRPIGAEK